MSTNRQIFTLLTVTEEPLCVERLTGGTFVEFHKISKTSSLLALFPWNIYWCADTNNYYLKDYHSEL